MKKSTFLKPGTGVIALFLLLCAPTQSIFAEDEPTATPTKKYSSVRTVVLENGTSLDIVIANSPSTPPGGVITAKNTAKSAAQKTGDVKISGVPAFDWSYGSSATAGAMIGGYYDRVGFTDMYTGPTNGGCMPLTNTSWGIGECPLSATKIGLDGRATRGHVDDYYVTEGNSGPDPYDTVPKWTEHTIGDCTGDYMKTSKWFPGSSSEPIFTEDVNKDGAAAFVFRTDGERVTASALETDGYDQYDAGYGLKLFFESRGYSVTTMYNQYIHPYKTYGFTYEQYKTEIDAGRPVMLHLSSGHVVVGIGYNALTNDEIIFHDSWSHVEHTMLWGGTYNTLFDHIAVTIVRLTDAIDPDAGCGDTHTPFSWIMFMPAITGAGQK